VNGKTCAALAITVGALAAAPAAAGDGPLFVTQNGMGVTHGSVRYVPVENAMADDTVVEAISTKDGSVRTTNDLVGSWGLPSTPAGTEGISRDGRELVLADTQSGGVSPSLFLVLSPQSLRIREPITLPGYFSYDALSPDGSRLYLIQYMLEGNVDLSRYVVRAYDLRAKRLLPGRIADRTQKGWVMHGWPVTRTTSADGRWVYTLYENPGGYPFVHALDTVRGVAHCVGIPMRNQNAIYNLQLALHGRRLAVHWRSGRPFLDVDTTTWRVTPSHGGGFPWWRIVLAASLLSGLAASFRLGLWKTSSWRGTAGALALSRGAARTIRTRFSSAR